MQTFRLIFFYLLIFSGFSKEHDTTNLLDRYFNLFQIRGAHDQYIQEVTEKVSFKPETSESKDEKDVNDTFEINSVVDSESHIPLSDKHQIGKKVNKTRYKNEKSKSMISKYDNEYQKIQNAPIMILINRGALGKTLRGTKSRKNGLKNEMGKIIKNALRGGKNKGEIQKLNNCCGYYLSDQGYYYNNAVKKDDTHYYIGQNYYYNQNQYDNKDPNNIPYIPYQNDDHNKDQSYSYFIYMDPNNNQNKDQKYDSNKDQRQKNQYKPRNKKRNNNREKDQNNDRNKDQNDDRNRDQNNSSKKDQIDKPKKDLNNHRNKDQKGDKQDSHDDRNMNQSNDRKQDHNYDRKNDQNDNRHGDDKNDHDDEQNGNSESYNPDNDSSFEETMIPTPEPPEGGINFMGNFKNVMKTGIMTSQWNIKKLKKVNTNKNQEKTKSRMCILNSNNEYCIGQEIGSKNKREKRC